MHVSCLDVPRAQGHIEDIKAKYGDSSNAYRVRVLGEFPTADDETVIPLELVLGAVGRNVSLFTTIRSGAWTSRASEMTAQRLPSDRRIKLLEPIKSWNSHRPDGHSRQDQGRVRRDAIRYEAQRKS